MKFEVDFDNGLHLVYLLYDYESTKLWREKLEQVTPNDYRPGSRMYNGFAERISLPLMAAELEEKINKLNEFLDIPIAQLDQGKNLQDELNRLHIHFPLQHKTKMDSEEQHQHLSEYNDIIHNLEAAIRQLKKPQNDMANVILTFADHTYLELPEQDYKYFNPIEEFGDLFIHYTHVGRHPAELFYANDFEAPLDQCIPQSRIQASFRMSFSLLPYSKAFRQEWFRNSFRMFYNERERKVGKWPFAIDDPKLAVGSLQIGHLLVSNRSNVRQLVGQSKTVSSWNFVK